VPIGPCVCCATGIYQEPRERLATQVPAHAEEAGSADAVPEVQWRYKWTADGEVYGPFSSDQMAAWAEQARVHFSPWAHCLGLSPPFTRCSERFSCVCAALQNLFGPDGVLVQKVERGKEPAGFYPSKRVDFSLYID